MVKNEELYFDSRDNKSKIYAKKWIPDIVKPVSILQIVHGMAEHIDRYDEFATYMAERGILVVGDDHLGHGKTAAANNGVKGYFCEQDPATVLVRDEHRLKKTIQSQYPGVPYFLLGHSMGSFIARNYLCKYGSGIDGAIIMGTGMQPLALLRVSGVLAGIQKLLLGGKHVSNLLNTAAFGAYLKKIENPKTPSDWLTKDADIVQKYIEDEDCGFVFTANGFGTLFTLIKRLHDKEYLVQMPKELPVFFVSGKEDPVGDYGQAVEAVYKTFTELGMQNVSCKLYNEDRHEILNELDRAQVYEDLYQWVKDAAH